MSEDIKFSFTEHGLQKISQGVAGLKSQLGNIGTALAAIGVGVAFKKMISEAIEAEDGIKKLSAALQGSNQYSKGAVASFEAFADSMQKTTRFSDDAAIGAATLARNLTGLSNDSIQQLIKRASDLAIVLGTDLESATQLLVKGVEGSTGALGRYGIKVKAGADETETFNNIMAATSKFAGQAEQDINSYSGSLAYLENNINNIFESLGKSLIKSESFKQTLKGTVFAVKELAEGIEKTFRLFDMAFNASPLQAANAELEKSKILLKELQEAQANKGFFGSDRSLEIRLQTELVRKQQEEVNKLTIANRENLKVENQKEQELLKSNAAMKKSADRMKELEAQANKLRGPLEKLREAFKFGGMSEEDKVKAETKENLRILDKSLKSKLVLEGEYETLRTKIVEEGDNKILAIKKKNAKEAADQAEKDLAKLEVFYSNIINQFASVVGAVEGGAEGARSLLTALPSAIGSIWGPIGTAIGGFIGKLISILSMTKDVMRDRINQFMQALPGLVQTISENVPVFMRALSDNLPILTRSAIASMPALATAFFDAILKEGPKLYFAIINDFISSIPLMIDTMMNYIMSGKFLEDIGKGIANGFTSVVKGIGKSIGGLGDTLGSIVGGVGDVVGSVAGGIGDVFGFASGGEVPKGFNSDNYPARLTSGELVVDRSTTSDLKNFLSNQSVLDAVLAELKKPITVQSTLTVDNKAFADVIFTLTRSNARLA